MPKREHKTEQSYIDWLKSLGCVFYAPLDYDNGLTELISNHIGTIQYNNTCVWDSNESAYLFTKDSSYSPKQGIVMWTGLNLDIQTINPDVTTLYETKIITYGSSWNGVPDDANSTINTAFGDRIFIATPQEIGITKNTWYKFGSQFYNSDNTRYARKFLDGVQKKILNYGSAIHTMTANDKNTYYINICANNLGYTNAVFYMRNLMIFNRALTQQEIMEVQGI